MQAMNTGILQTASLQDVREENEQRVYDALEKLCIPFARVDHAPAATIQDCEQIEQVLGCAICKNLFLCNRQKTVFYLLMLCGHKEFVTKDVSKQLGVARLSFGDASQMERLLGLLPGSVSVMGLMNDQHHEVQLLIDEDLVGDEYLGCHPCRNTTTLKLRWQDVLKTFLPATGHTPVFVHID